MLKTTRHIASFVYHAARGQGGMQRLLRKAWAIYRVEGYNGILRRLPLKRRRALDAAQFWRDAYLARELVSGDCRDARPQGSIAVIVHAYYPELFAPMVEALANIPWPFDLYLSVTSDTARQAVTAMAAQLPRAAHVDVQVTPNRGRDIAPMLVTFANAIRAHRYVLHIHTKKSLYSGRERTEWRDYLIEGLLGSERRIRQIFNQFETNATLGIVYPDTFDGVPYWAHTWLQNRGIALALGARLGIDVAHRHYIDAPMGSMFWARTEALRPLLDLHLGYADFPEELGQTDGTLQHTIERFFVLSALRAGFSQRVMLDASKEATLFFSPGRKNLEHYFAVGIRERILALAESAQIVSFDIFDTLLVRPWFAPDNLFSYLEQEVADRFGIADFARLRKEAEFIARQSGAAADVDIAQIYHALGALIGSDERAKEILALEREAEFAMLRPNAEVCAAARSLAAAGKRLVLVSDMYLDVAFLKRLLAKHDLDFFSGLYVSNAVGARKDSGTMWQILPEQENVPPERWLHVGDNEHSDLQRPLDAGYLHPVHIMRAADQFAIFNEEAGAWMAPQDWQEGLLLGLLANRLFLPGRAHEPIGLDSDNRRVELRSLRDFGYLTIGPALTVFMAWLIDRARQDSVELLLYASREGHLLRQAHALIADRLGADMPLGEYFLCSRAAAGLAATRDSASMEVMLGAHFQGSFADLLRRRYCIEDLAPFTARLGEEAIQRSGALPEDRPRFVGLLEQCMDLLVAEAAVARERYQRYAENVIAGRRAALVDIGYSATIQKALANFVENIAGGYYFVTTDNVRSVESFGQFAKGCFGDQINPFHSDIPLYQYSLLFEAVLTAPHGQLLGFAADGMPRYKPPGLAQRHFEQIEDIHAGALEFLTDTLAVVGNAFTHLGTHHRASQLPIRQIMEYRWRLACDLRPLHVEDNFSGNEEISIFEFYDRKRERLPGVLD
jgi:FMN phosphatase YigB (HAD superfamily)